MMRFLKVLLTWWNDQNLSTLLFTWRRGNLVGIDEQGNCYYEDRAGQSINGKVRRWVVYNGDIETTRISPEWHGWMHYTVDDVPADAGQVKREWMKPGQINMTGTKDAHRPAGRADTAGHAEGYDAWTPE